MNNTGIRDEVYSQMQRIFQETPAIDKVILFGSRAKGNYKYNSDIDIAIVGGGDDFLFCERIALLLDELPTLCKFDVIGYNRINNEQLKNHIDRVGIVIFERNGKQRRVRIYVDASALGGAFNQKFAEQTAPFWIAVQTGEIVIIVSDVLEGEVNKAPKVVRDFYNALPESQIERVVSTEESNHLAERYIAEKVVGPTSLDDCKHIALATLAHADVLVSWNFKHIVNINRIKGYNGVNMKLGYPQIEIRTPYEVINDAS